MTMIAHPRLYLGAPEQARLQDVPTHPVLQTAATIVADMAAEYRKSPEFTWELNTHNAHLIRARNMQGRIVTLLAQWRRSGDASYRDAAMAHVRAMGDWEYWSWITWREGNAADDAIFDLSYGENSATLAIAWDWLHDSLSEAERADFLAVVARPVASFMKHTTEGQRAWWFGKKDSNWNTVCAGGGGMLALAMYEVLPEAATMVARALESVEPFVGEIRDANGAWPEGIGYWNYGMRYFYMFALSHERATGGSSKWFRGKAIEASLDFPMRFAPCPGVGVSFGDVNHWHPLPFHFAAAARMQRTRTLAELELHLRAPGSRPGWPEAAELLCLHPGTQPEAPATEAPYLHHYKGQDWVAMADRLPSPTLYVTVRGGTTEVPHAHTDLTSLHAVIGDEHMLVSLGPSGYLDSTFSPRRWEIFEMGPASKNVLLVNGVGIVRPSEVKTRCTMTDHGPAVRLDATDAMGPSRGKGEVVKRYHRLVMLLPDQGVLVVDRIVTHHAALFEQRFFTRAEATASAAGFRLKGTSQRARLSFAANEAASTHSAQAPMTRPGPVVPTMMRWVSDLLHEDYVSAAFLSASDRKASVAIVRDGKDLRFDLQSAGGTLSIATSDSLVLRS